MKKRKTLFTEIMFLNNQILEEDADEILLALLAKDTEPIPVHLLPYRRYIAPSHYEFTIKAYRYDHSMKYYAENDQHPGWKRVMMDWWIRDGDSYGLPKGESL